MSFETPILFLVFNRLHETEKVFEKIKEIKPKYLFVAADGPRLNVPGDLESCIKVRELITNSIDWDCELKTLFRQENLGCGNAVSRAIDWFFQHTEEGIILEDDCLPEIAFFQFCCEMLARYRSQDNVMMVSGFSFLDLPNSSYSYFFSSIGSVWGWATWKRSWKQYSFEPLENLNSIPKTFRRINEPQLREIFQEMLHDVLLLKLDTWDIQWAYTIDVQKGLCIVPLTNLIQNIGYKGAHASGHASPSQKLKSKPLDLKTLRHPDTLQIDLSLEKQYTLEIITSFNDAPSTIGLAKVKTVSKKIIEVGMRETIRQVNKWVVPEGYKFRAPRLQKTLLSNIFKRRFSKTVLVSHLQQAFTKPITHRHTAGLECKFICECFDALGYNVDLVGYNEQLAVSDIDYSPYDVVFGQGIPFENYFYSNNRRAITICYVTGNHPFFLNAQALLRLNDYYKRNDELLAGSSLFHDKLLPLQFSFSTYLLVWGGKFTVETLRKYFFSDHKKILQVPGFYYSFHTPNFSSKNFDRVKSRFLWFGSSKFIHRGLDLLLDIFLKRSDIYLHVCGPIDHEPDFWSRYESRLSDCKNIFIHGFVDIASPVFKRILADCAYLVYPSVSDANSASVLTVVGNGGLIPIVTENSSLDFPSFSIEIESGPNDSVEERNIEQAIEKALAYSNDELLTKGQQAFEYVTKNHSSEKYKQMMLDNLTKILVSK
jgi:hypothetical protein